jgi:hypothetical protein
MATENKKEMEVVEMRANLFGGYEQGRDPWADPWAAGGYQPEPAQETVQETKNEPQQEAFVQPGQVLPKPVRQSTLVERVIPTVPLSKPLNLVLANAEAQARREASQRELDLYSENKRFERSQENAQYYILDGVVWSIREALRLHGIPVSRLENVANFQHRPIMSHVDFNLTEIGKTNFKAAIAQRFVEEFLKNNPKRAHMFTAWTPLPQGVQIARHFLHDGLLLRGIGAYDIATDSHRVRVDCVYAIATEENLLCQTETPSATA